MSALLVTDRPSASSHAATAACTEVTLTDAALAELAGALAAVRTRGLPLLAVRREDFPLPTLGEELAATAAALESGPGAAVIRGLPTARSEADVRTLFWGLGRHLGIAVPQDATGRVVGRSGADLRPCPSGRFHTEGSDAVALLVTGGHSRCDLVCADAVLAEVARRRPTLAMRLFDDFPLDRCGGHAAGERPYRTVPLACRCEGRFSLRYDRASIEGARRFRGVAPLSAEERELLDLVDDVVATPALRSSVRLGPGDLLLVNNWSVLHRLDGDGSPLRLWLTLRQGRLLPAGFTWPTPAFGDRQGRGGVDPRDLAEPARR